MRTFFRLILILIITCLVSGHLFPLYAEWSPYDPEVATWEEFSAKKGNMYLTLLVSFSVAIEGHTTYRVSDPDITSELEFPLDSRSYLGIDLGLAYRKTDVYKHDRSRLTLKWLTNVSRQYAGKMKDSDWSSDAVDIEEVGAAHPGLDVYSESDADLEARITDLNYIYNFAPAENITIGVMAGYRTQDFAYDIRDLKQVGYGPYAPMTDSTPGRVAKYEVKYEIPYLGLNTDMLLADEFRLGLQVGYSNWVRANDVDDHMLRDFLAKGRCKGDAFLINLNVDLEFLPQWTLQLNGTYIDIDAKGTSYLFFYAGPKEGYSETIDQKTTSSLRIISLGVKYRF